MSLFKRDPKLKKVLGKAEFLLKSTELNNKKYVPTALVKKMIIQLIKND